MKRTLKITLFSLILLFVGSVALSTPAISQAIPLQQLTNTATATATITPTATATTTTGITITAVQPGTVSNEVATELVVTGSGFVNGAVVILANFGALDTTFVSSNLLRATVPASTPAGTYSLSVVNPDASSASLANAVTITGPAGPTSTPVPSSTPGPTAYIRPLLVVQSYGASSEIIAPGENYDFEMTFANAGQLPATNVIATFTTGDFIPRVTGGVQALGTIGAGGNHRFWQPLAATRDIAGKTVAILEVKVSYTDANGTTYSDTFALTFPVVRQGGGVAPTSTPTPTSTATPTATATPTVGPLLRPQLLITSYNTDVSQLEPGVTFTLQLSVQNAGNADAENVTMILGGGSSSGSSTSGTPSPGGGLSGAGGEFSNFAPVNSSNVSSLGNLAVGQSLQASQTLIVNASTKAGAYPVKVSFVYNDDNNSSFVDDQVITLLVYQQPLVDLNFYIQPAPLFVGQPGSLPLQVVNTGKNSAVFGNFTVTAPSAQLSNNTIFVGALEPGGFFPLDAQIIPEQPGMLELLVSIGYTNDFNQQQLITKTLSIEVIDAPIIEPPIDGGEVPPDGGFPPIDGGGVPGGESTQETFAQKLWRFFLGLIGLDSGIPEPEFPTGGYGVPYGSPYGQPYGAPYGAP